MVNPSIDDGTFCLYTLATGCSNDISPFLCFNFNDTIYCFVNQEQKSFPLESREICGCWVGIFEHVGAPMTWKILTEKKKNAEGYFLF